MLSDFYPPVSDHQQQARLRQMTPSSKQIITEAHTRFNQLEDYGFDWSSFYNGYVEGRVAGLRSLKEAKTLIADMLSVYREDDKTNIVTFERFEAWQEKFKELSQ